MITNTSKIGKTDGCSPVSFDFQDYRISNVIFYPFSYLILANSCIANEHTYIPNTKKLKIVKKIRKNLKFQYYEKRVIYVM